MQQTCRYTMTVAVQFFDCDRLLIVLKVLWVWLHIITFHMSTRKTKKRHVSQGMLFCHYCTPWGNCFNNGPGIIILLPTLELYSETHRSKEHALNTSITDVKIVHAKLLIIMKNENTASNQLHYYVTGGNNQWVFKLSYLALPVPWWRDYVNVDYFRNTLMYTSWFINVRNMITNGCSLFEWKFTYAEHTWAWAWALCNTNHSALSQVSFKVYALYSS